MYVYNYTNIKLYVFSTWDLDCYAYWETWVVIIVHRSTSNLQQRISVAIDNREPHGMLV